MWHNVVNYLEQTEVDFVRNLLHQISMSAASPVIRMDIPTRLVTIDENDYKIGTDCVYKCISELYQGAKCNNRILCVEWKCIYMSVL